jgi:hypothetical protein
MISGELEVWQIRENRLTEKLPDGSTAVFDTQAKTVPSINETAAAAFQGCRDRRAAAELERAGLVACSGPLPGQKGQTSRRSMLKAVGTTTTTTTAAPTATLSGIAPNVFPSCTSIGAGFVITGMNTHFGGASVVSFSAGSLTLSNVVVNSLTSSTLNMTGPVTVTVTTGTEVAVGTNILTREGCA